VVAKRHDVTYDNVLEKYSISTKKSVNLIYTKCVIYSMECSKDGKLLLTGHNYDIGIYDMKNFKNITTEKLMRGRINSIEISKINTMAFCADNISYIKKITWKPNADKRKQFDLTQESVQVTNTEIHSMKLINNDSELIVGSNCEICLLNSQNMEIIQNFEVGISWFRYMKVSKNGQNTLLFNRDRSLNFFDNKAIKINPNEKQELIRKGQYAWQF